MSSRILEESSDLRFYMTHLLANTKPQLDSLPDWVRPTAYDFVRNFQRSRFIGFFETPSFLPFFSQAISRVISFLIFFFSAFYFLKDGTRASERLLAYIPKEYKVDIEILLRKVNTILSGYLRGEIFLIFLMSTITYIALAIVGIRFAFIIALFSGFAEIVPVIGPIVAGGVAATVALFTGTNHFGLTPVNAAIVVVIIYFGLRQLEDYFVIPYVMGKITKLPPFVIFFSVIAGGHIAGVLGLVLAVPTAAIIKLLLEFSFDKINPKN
jgi:predicted PurR-regulated permease PerM